MSNLCYTGRQSPGKRTAGRLSSTAAFFLTASITVSFLAGSSATTPLFAIYQAQWGFSPLMVTLIFGVYALAVLVALLFTGRLSDHVGRRPVLLIALLAQLPVMALFAFASGSTDLLLARVLQGVVTGAAMGAIGASLIDIDRERGATANAVAPGLGTAAGALLAGILVQFLPAPTRLVYGVMAAVYALQAAGVWWLSETVSPRAGALASLAPRITLPAGARGPLLVALPVLIAAWALSGFYASLGPMLVKGLLGSGSPLLAGLVLFVLTASGGLAVLLLQRHAPVFMMILGTLLLAAGVAIDLAALSLHSLAAFLLGASVAGMGFGTGFQGAMRTVVQYAEAHERAGLLSVIFIISYVSMGVPSVLAGAWVARHGNIMGTAGYFGAAVIALALAAMISAFARRLLQRPVVAQTG